MGTSKAISGATLDRTFSRRQLLKLSGELTLLATLEALAGCNGSASGFPTPSLTPTPPLIETLPSPSKTPLPTEVPNRPATLRVGFVPAIIVSPLFIGIEQGYYRKLGITLDLRQFETGTDQIAALQTGQIDIVTGVNPYPALFDALAKGASYSIFLDGAREAPGRGLLSVVVSSGAYEQGLRSKESFSRLRGKQIGVVAPGALTQFITAKLAQTVGLDLTKDVGYVYAPTSELIETLGKGKLDAISLPNVFAVEAERRGQGKIIAYADDIVPNLQLGVVLAQNEFLQTRRSEAERFAMAYIQAARLHNRAATSPKDYPALVSLLTKYALIGDKNLLVSLAPRWSAFDESGLPNTNSILDYVNFYVSTLMLINTPVPQEQAFDLSLARSATARLDSQKPFG